MERDLKLSEHCAGAACSTCGKAEVFEHPDAQLRHCFSCGESLTSIAPAGLAEVVEDIFRASRQHLLDSADVRTFLIDERRLHPQVLVDSAVGVLPPDLDVTQLFLPKLEKAEAERTRVLEAPRKPGRRTKKEQEATDAVMAAVEHLKKQRDDFVRFFEGRGGWLLFAYTDRLHRKVCIRLCSPETGESAEMSFGLASGVFNHALFAPGKRATSLRDLQRRSIVVASEFDALQLQSLGARLAERGGLEPQAGYLKVAGVGAGTIDATTVRALGQMPLVIVNGGDRANGLRIVEALRQELNLLIATVPEAQTLEDLLRYESTDDESCEALLQLSAAASLVTRPFPAVRSEIDEWRSMETKR